MPIYVAFQYNQIALLASLICENNIPKKQSPLDLYLPKLPFYVSKN